ARTDFPLHSSPVSNPFSTRLSRKTSLPCVSEDDGPMPCSDVQPRRRDMAASILCLLKERYLSLRESRTMQYPLVRARYACGESERVRAAMLGTLVKERIALLTRSARAAYGCEPPAIGNSLSTCLPCVSSETRPIS